MKGDRFKELQKEAEKKKYKIKTPSSKEINVEDFKTLNGYNPNRNPQQLKAHKSKAPNVLFAGDAGGGKTAWLCNSLIHHCLKFPKSRVLLLKQTLVSFMKTTYLELMKWVPQNLVKEHNKHRQMIIFVNGGCLMYDGLYDPMQKLTSLEISAWGMDQCEFLDEPTFHLLNSRLRLNIEGVEYRAFLTSNPCAGFLRDRFVKGKDLDYAYIPAIAEQNPFLPDGYLERLEKLPYEIRQILRNRDWDLIQSQNCFYEILEIDTAMKRGKISGKKSVGIDVGRGHDESCIAVKEGNYIRLGYCQITENILDVISPLKNLGIGKDIPIAIDVIGVGGGLADRLKELGYWIIEIKGSERAKDTRMFTTRKAEILWKLRQDLPALSLKKDKKLREQMRGIAYKVMNDNRIASETIQEIRKSGRESPDRLVAVSLSNVAFEEEREKEEKEYINPINYSIDMSDMIRKGKIGFEEVTLPLEYLEKNEKDLFMAGRISAIWREKREEFYKYWEFYKESGGDESFIFKRETYRY